MKIQPPPQNGNAKIHTFVISMCSNFLFCCSYRYDRFKNSGKVKETDLTKKIDETDEKADVSIEPVAANDSLIEEASVAVQETATNDIVSK